MYITRIEPLKGRRYRIWLNDEPAFRLYAADLAEYPLQEGEELSEERLQEICSRILVKRAKLRALHLLEKYDRTEWQLRRKLSEGEYPDSVIDEAVEYVKSYHYIDDQHYAEIYIRDHHAVKSRRQIEADLMNRGVGAADIQSAFDTAEGLDPLEPVRMWIRKKHFDRETADAEAVRKFTMFLQRKGFSYGDIRDALFEGTDQ